MLELLRQTSTSVVAVDFGACSVRAVQLQKRGPDWRIHHWANIEIEPTAAQAPEPDYASQVRLAFGPGTFSGRRAAIVLSPPEVEYKLLEVPSAVLAKGASEVREALQFELDRQMPWPVAECEIAVWPVTSGQSGNANAIVVASRNAAVQRFVDVLAAQRVDCVRADILPNALIRACGRDADGLAASPEALWGILDMGFRACRLYLVHGNRLVYARVLRAGGRELTDTLARALHVEFRIAEQYKRVYGLKQTDRGFRSPVDGINRISEEALPGVLYAILRPSLESLAGEIERSCRFALGRLQNVTMSGIYVVGGGSRMQGLADVLAGHLGVPVVLPRPSGAYAGLGTGRDGRDHPACSPAQFPVLVQCIGQALAEGQR